MPLKPKPTITIRTKFHECGPFSLDLGPFLLPILARYPDGTAAILCGFGREDQPGKVAADRPLRADEPRSQQRVW